MAWSISTLLSALCFAATAAGSHAGSAQDADAQFLMRASFGPTRQSLAEISNMTHAEWIMRQADLPVESHRAFFRQHSSPRFMTDREQVGNSRSPCSAGARWEQHALSWLDVGKSITIAGGRLSVEGVYRTDIDDRRFLSRWVSLSNWTGHICRVYEGLGEDVHLCEDSSCAWNKYFAMPNPAMYLKGQAQALGGVPTASLRPGVFVLEQDWEDCPILDEAGATITHMGKFYRHSARIMLSENSLERPSSQLSHCVPRNILNERHCAVTPLVEQHTPVPGLKASVYSVSTVNYPSVLGLSVPVAEVVEEEINHPSRGHPFPGWPIMYNLAAKWTGELTIHTPGLYTFYLNSDDGSQLFIDDQLVVDNGGYHGMVEKDGQVELLSGPHDILIEFYQGWGGLGIIFSWSGPDSGDEKMVVPPSALSTLPPAQGDNCLVACGSPGEVANDPKLGHQFPYQGNYGDWGGAQDTATDNRHAQSMDRKLTKASVWFQKALNGDDQLRQRAAWSLSQIFVAAEGGLDSHLSEMWVSYYDIFVRHGLGNFRDVLQQVTYSPVMGVYLTHVRSTSYDFDGRFPNENYAREVMQLFTIGLDELNPDGTPKVDANGTAIPTYDNRNIQNFARIFTGFDYAMQRHNAETASMWVDPMRMLVDRHDVHPKTDLKGNFIGDGYPLCEDPLPPRSFLRQGARWEYLGPYGADDALELGNNSALHAALCGGGAAICAHSAVVELQESLPCHGSECATEVKFAKVGMVFFKYVPPICVHRWVGQPTAHGSAEPATGAIVAPSGSGLQLPVVMEKGPCVKEDGGWTHSTQLDDIHADNEHNETRQQECLDKCITAGAKGCVLIWDQWNQGCHAVFSDLKGGNGGARHTCWKLDFSSGQLGRSYMMYPSRLPQWPHGYNGCDAGTEVQSIVECEEAIQSLGMQVGSPWFGNYDQWVPRGCSYSDRMHYQMGTGAASWSLGNICRSHIEVNSDGEVTLAKRSTKFQVKWRGVVPQAGTHTVYERSVQVFASIPTKDEAKGRLFIGAYPPTSDCSSCEGDVKVYGPSSPVTIDTVFEIDGKFYRNIESLVFLETGESFRNPPVFLKSNSDHDAVRSAIAEVEALLDHLFHHDNVPAFIGKRLIQRFGTSTPSLDYVARVAQAFREGDFNGMGFSGKYGDLGATIAAILLYPESDAHAHVGGLEGSLREPMLKLTGMMRAMEYRDSEGEFTVIRDMSDVLGQFPYKSPTVFNFYMADYALPELKSAAEPEPEAEPEEPEPEPEEPEPEPEPTPEPEEPEPETPALGPEFQILTPQYFIGYLNGMSSLIHAGVGWDCDNGESLGTSVHTVTDKRWRQVCPQGRLTWRGSSSSAEEIVEEMNVLLTGGRLTHSSKAVVLNAFEEAREGSGVYAAQQAIMMTAEFNTLGDPMPQPEPRQAVIEESATATRPYKATLVIYLDGGADTFNMLVPKDCSLYDEYTAVRTDLALQPWELLDLPTPGQGQACEQFGLHASFPFLKSLYDKQEAAFVSNVGNLVEPMDLQQYRTGETQRCIGLFSHSDQTSGAQTLKCQDKGVTARGAGGRIADGLAAGGAPYSTTSFSLAGNAIWPSGVTTERELVDDNGARRFYQYEQWRDVISNMTAQKHGNPYSEAFNQAFIENVAATEHLARVMVGTELKTNYATDSWLQRELKQVATLIAARQGRQAERDFFFVSMGGWDHHSNMKSNTANMFRQIDDALRGFVAEMEAQGVWDSVVVATESEFARTLDSNGGGSDHAYAGNHFLIGGGVKGGRIFNKFPETLVMGGPRDLGRGSFIPEYPWESMMVPIGEWMGLQEDQLDTTFPNLHKFNSTHIIPTADLFKS